MSYTSKDIMELKESTGAGILDCKKALEETNGDKKRAAEILREKGMASAAKKASSSRIASEGVVDSYLHMGGKIGVLVEINCETDFVAKTDKFKELAHNIAMHVAAASPLYLNESEVPTEELEKEKEILRAQAKEEKKPEAVIEKMVEGRVKKYYAEICLMAQPFVKDPSKTIATLVAEEAAGIGEKITVRRFVRFEMGEGLEKRSEDFAAEVEAQMS